jgi:hypothetical protein
MQAARRVLDHVCLGNLLSASLGVRTLADRAHIADETSVMNVLPFFLSGLSARTVSRAICRTATRQLLFHVDHEFDFRRPFATRR